MRKLSLALSLALTVSAVGTAASSAFAAETAVVTAATDVSVQKAQLQAFADLKALFTDKTDLNKLKADYIAKLQTEVKAVNPEIDTKILFAIEAGISGGLSAGQVKQAVDKGLQWYFYAAVTNLTKTDVKNALDKGDGAAAQASLDKALELFNGALYPTAGKRDTGNAKYGVRTQDLLSTVVVPGLKKAVQDKDVHSYNLFRQMFDKTLIKVFHLGVVAYAEKIPTLANEADAKIGVTEGYFFYMPIVASLKAGNQEAAESIEKAFASGDPKQIDPAKIKQAFIAAFNGKISGYVQKTLVSLEKKDLQAAQVTAMEGNMFLAAQEVLLKERLGADAYNAAVSQAESYFNAVKAGSAEEAKLQSFQVLKQLAQADGLQLKLNTDAITVNGQEKKVDAKSYVHAKTFRTLVPTRVIAEALGAEVSFENSTQTVVIVKNGTEIRLAVNSSTVVKNGEADVKLKLDQAVEVKSGRTFIPLRAAAEMFGNKVFYSKDEIVIVK
ncbi:stalk domain-containing protein [Paenibacillus gansuensis]|uniref:Stalk domain-containing protein n=1 Tax=Paenibacillus gansuensis TaxID=306542 RepID=A0ABW5PFU6_9BACL